MSPNVDVDRRIAAIRNAVSQSQVAVHEGRIRDARLILMSVERDVEGVRSILEQFLATKQPLSTRLAIE